ncbi:uncharacterized protein LOC124641763 [Helicoverpa zea]|uniref:uncharacterized protein LOC124641763 n=1 Tax=Helicoverpa zea TaxID=7113 RepID=UPI001F5A45BF|nr:uncharacterized protein LOC124641763 [Helicoverpa zea]
MASIFSKNGILSGRLDQYCLICAEHFASGEDTLAHIIDSKHKEKLEACGYFAKYSEDFIRKANGVYFCEPCGLTFPTVKKVELHISEPTHIDEKTKGSSWLNRVQNDIIAFNKFVITDDAWNGCVEDTCILCNDEFEDSAPHKITRSHVFNLIKSNVVFDKDEAAVYRVIDAKSHQCLTCNTIIGNDLKNHFNSTEHKAAYKMYEHSKRETNEVQKENKNANTPKISQNVNATTEKTELKNNNKVVNGNVAKTEKTELKDTNKIVNGNAANVKKVEEVKNVKKEVKQDAKKPVETKPNKQVEKPKDKVADLPKKQKAAELDKILCKNLGAKNYITSGDGEKWCLLCEWLLVESPESHIRSPHHQSLLAMHKKSIAEKDSNNNNNTSSKDEKINLFDNVDKYQANDVNIDLINETAFCKKCSKNIDFNTGAIDKHIDGHKTANAKTKKSQATPLAWGMKSNGTEKTTLYTKPVTFTGKDKSPRKVPSESQVQEFAKKHGLSHNRADNSFYCNPCSRRLSTNLNDLQNHVASKLHVDNMAKKSSKIEVPAPPVKVRLLETVKSFWFTENEEEGCVMIINDKYWINAFGFFLIAKLHDKIICHGCRIDLTPENVMQHIAMSDYHKELLDKCLLITSVEGEFIREIKPDVYHCGFCNITEDDWDDMIDDHLTSYEHKKERASSEEYLRKQLTKTDQRFQITQAHLDELFKRFMVVNRH